MGEVDLAGCDHDKKALTRHRLPDLAGPLVSEREPAETDTDGLGLCSVGEGHARVGVLIGPHKSERLGGGPNRRRPSTEALMLPKTTAGLTSATPGD
jgi:hypothetical protein